MMRKWLGGCAILLLMLGWATPTLAGGIVTREGDELGLAQLRILYDIDAARNQTTVTLKVVFTGSTWEDFGVLLPLPAAPFAVQIESREENGESYPGLKLFTSWGRWAMDPLGLTVIEPPNVCHGLLTMYGEYPHSGPAWGDYLEDAPQILDSVEAVQAWMEAHDYMIAPDILASYRGSTFVALQAAQGDYSGGPLPALSVTYPGTDAILPLRLFANDPAYTASIEVAVLADQTYAIPSYARRSPDPAILRRTSILDYDAYLSPDENRGISSLYAANPALARHLTDLLAGEQAYVIEYRGPASALLAADLGDEMRAEVERLLRPESYFTLFYFEPNIQNLAQDPVLIPDAESAEVSNVLDATGTNAFTYWGCATPPLPEPDPLLPEQTYVPTLDKEVIHPAGWELSRFAVTPPIESRHCENPPDELWLDVLAPQPVTLRDLQAALRGESAPPMLVISAGQYEMTLEEAVGVPMETTPRWYSPWRYHIEHSEWRYTPFTEIGWDCTVTGAVQLQWVVPDWEVNQVVYEAMLEQARSYHYYLDPDLPQTAFLSGKSRYSYYPERPMTVAYPTGWQIHTTPDVAHYYWIEPDSATDGPRLTIMGWEMLLDVEPDERNHWLPYDQIPVWLEAVRAYYGLPAAFDLEAVTLCGNPGLTLNERLVPFEREGRRGAFLLVGDDVIEISVSQDEPESDWNTLLHMLDTMVLRGYCG